MQVCLQHLPGQVSESPSASSPGSPALGSSPEAAALPHAPPCCTVPGTPDLPLSCLLLPFSWVRGRAAELIPKTAFEPPVWVRTLLQVPEAYLGCLKLGREFILILRSLVGPKGSQA